MPRRDSPGGLFFCLSILNVSVNLFFMSQDNLIKLQCSVCKRINYWTSKNRKKVERKLEFSKYCKWCKKHTTHKEGKKK